MTDEPPMPRNFGWRWLLWVAWCNAITILSALQAVFTALTSDPDSTLVSHRAFHIISVCNLVLVIVVAQVKKNSPPPPPPTKGP